MDWTPLLGDLAKTILPPAVALLVAWAIGNRLSEKWDDRRRRRELAMESRQEFYRAYGAFFANWKQWNIATEDSERRWPIYKQATEGEGIIEALLVRACSELVLTDEQLTALGCYRQAYQRLREQVRDQKPLGWKASSGEEYRAFKSLAVRAATIVSLVPPESAPSTAIAQRQLLIVTSNRWEHIWKKQAVVEPEPPPPA